MIRVEKPIAPHVLTARGATAAQTHCNEYDAAPAEYRRGTKTFDFDKSVYAAREVKEALLTAQHGKCAFCESLVRHISYGAVEHYRPKAGYKQQKGDSLKHPAITGSPTTGETCSSAVSSATSSSNRIISLSRLVATAPGRTRTNSAAKNRSSFIQRCSIRRNTSDFDRNERSQSAEVPRVKPQSACWGLIDQH